jgi:poly(A) polymerase
VDVPGIPAPLPDLLQQVAREQRLALVGGAVRDLLLHRVHNDPWRGVPDLDLMAEGLAIDLVRRLERALPAGALRAVREHGAYGTVEVELVIAGQPVLLDVASARAETYPQPGENPVVSLGALADDLARRDFSINAMALDLASGALLDPHGGQGDLQRRQLRLLHAGSLRDDPTRLVRGARYAARLGFGLEPASAEQARATLAAWPWPWRLGDPPGQAPPALGTRLRMELELLLEREPWRQALAVLQRWGGLMLLDGQLQADHGWLRRLRWAQRLGLPPLAALVAGAADPLALAERLQLPHRQHQLLAQLLVLRRRLAAAAPQPSGAGAWCALLEAPGLAAEAVALALCCGMGPRRPLLRWLLRWRSLKAPCSAADLIAQGWRPGPELGAELRRLRLLRLAEEHC